MRVSFMSMYPVKDRMSYNRIYRDIYYSAQKGERLSMYAIECSGGSRDERMGYYRLKSLRAC
jgi:hypothetical protein